MLPVNALIKVSSRSTIAVILFPAFTSALIYIRLCMKPRSCSLSDGARDTKHCQAGDPGE